MTTTLKQQIEELKKKRRRLAIWEAIHHLVDDKFISKDGRKVSGIRVPNTEDLVPEEEIDDVLQFIADGPLEDLRKDIEAIENLSVIVITDKEKA